MNATDGRSRALVRDRDTRGFLCAWAISAVGSGAAYIALMLLVSSRYDARGS